MDPQFSKALIHWVLGGGSLLLRFVWEVYNLYMTRPQ
jgi:hypothetical protein